MLTVNTGFVRLGSVQLESLEIGNLQKGTEREREKRGRERRNSEEGWTHTDNPSENKEAERRCGSGVEVWCEGGGELLSGLCLCPQQRSSKAMLKTGEKEWPNIG